MWTAVVERNKRLFGSNLLNPLARSRDRAEGNCSKVKCTTSWACCHMWCIATLPHVPRFRPKTLLHDLIRQLMKVLSVLSPLLTPVHSGAYRSTVFWNAGAPRVLMADELSTSNVNRPPTYPPLRILNTERPE